MSILPIRVFPDPILRKRAAPALRVDASVRRLAHDMLETMEHARGIGLAAPQVGVLKRVITIHAPEQEPRAMVNPEIVKREGSRKVQEGCLSVPGYTGLVNRSVTVDVRSLDLTGGRLQLTAEEILAQAIEHEVDHLDGILFLDHLKAHKDLAKTGVSPEEPHWHEVGYTIYAIHEPRTRRDKRLVETLQAAARLSELSSESSMSEAVYDLHNADEDTQGEDQGSSPRSRSETIEETENLSNV